MVERAINFGAGPSALPLPVLEEAAKGLLNFEKTGIGIAEISHRSREFTGLVSRLEDLIRTQLSVPSTHRIMFTQGGGTGQFSAVVLNLLARHRLLHPELSGDERMMDYVVTGNWSKKAVDEARRLGNGKVNIAADGRKQSKDGKTFDKIPAHDAYTFSHNPALIYYCENETVHGLQFSHDETSPTSFPFQLLPKDTLLPLVGDHSSSFMSRPIPRLADHAVIFAGAQKNLGPAGLTILIVRQDCIVDVDAAAQVGATPVPLTMSYKTLADSNSLYNTPPVFAMYVSLLVLQRMKDMGGVEYYEELNKRKAATIYAVLKEGEEKGVLKRKVQEGSGSWMNVIFDVNREGGDARFLAGAEARNMKALKGHR
jgi:phosphoserine aminotransferase